MCHTPIISCGVTLRTCLFSPCVAVFSYCMYMTLRLYLLYEHIYEFMQAAADSQVDIIPHGRSGVYHSPWCNSASPARTVQLSRPGQLTSLEAPL